MVGVSGKVDVETNRKLLLMSKLWPPLDRTIEVVAGWYGERIATDGFESDRRELQTIILPRRDLVSFRVDIGPKAHEGLTKSRDILRVRTLDETLDKLVADFWKRKHSLFAQLEKLEDQAAKVVKE